MKFHVYMLLSGFTCETCVLVSNAIDFTLLTASHVFARPSLTLLVTSGISFLNVYCHLLLPQCSPGYVSPREASQRPRAVEPRRAGILQEPPPTTPTPTQYPPPPPRTLTTCNLASQLLSPHSPPPPPPSRPALLLATASLSLLPFPSTSPPASTALRPSRHLPALHRCRAAVAAPPAPARSRSNAGVMAPPHVHRGLRRAARWGRPRSSPPHAASMSPA
jgi:hypothetical protein